MAVGAPEKVRKRIRVRLKDTRGPVCLNCQADIETHFCPHCGQKNTKPDLSLFGVLHEFAEEVFHYDSKAWRTVRTLITQPGRLPANWSSGRRADYISPVRLYLTVTFIFFLLAAGHRLTNLNIGTASPQKNANAILAELKNESISPGFHQLLLDEMNKLKLNPDQAATYRKELDQAEQRYVAEHKGVPENWVEHQAEKLARVANGDPSRFSELLLNELPKALFVVLPLFAVALKLLYLRQKRTYVEHLVFLLYLHSFMFIALLPLNLVHTAWMDVLMTFVVLIGLPGYAFFAMLRYYGQPWWLTLLKSWVLGATYIVLSGFGTLFAIYLVANSLPDPANPATSTVPSTQATAK